MEHISLEAIQKFMKIYASRCRPLSREFHISPTAFDILLFLYNNPEFKSARDIVQIRGIKASLVSVNVEKLVEDGYLERKQDSADRRRHNLFLTDKALQICRRGRAMQDELFESFLEGVDEQERQTLERVFLKIDANLSRIQSQEDGRGYEE